MQARLLQTNYGLPDAAGPQAPGSRARKGATCDEAEVPRLFCVPLALAPRFLPRSFPLPEPPLLPSPMKPGASVRTMLTTVGHSCRRAATTGASSAAASAAGAVTKCTMCTPATASEALPVPPLLPLLLHKSPFTLLLTLLFHLLLLLLSWQALVLMFGDVVAASAVSDCPAASASGAGSGGDAGPLRMPMRRKNPNSGCLPRPATSLNVRTASTWESRPEKQSAAGARSHIKSHDGSTPVRSQYAGKLSIRHSLLLHCRRRRLLSSVFRHVSRGQTAHTTRDAARHPRRRRGLSSRLQLSLNNCRSNCAHDVVCCSVLQRAVVDRQHLQDKAKQWTLSPARHCALHRTCPPQIPASAAATLPPHQQMK